MSISDRLNESLRPAALHLFLGLLAACVLATLLFFVWYPSPYDQFSGGRDLFVLLMGVDVICGPLLTLLLYTRSKPKKLLVLDLTLVLSIQVAALIYGLHVAWQARPVYLVAEYDRLKAITNADMTEQDRNNIRPELRSGFWDRPKIVGIRKPKSIAEKNKVMFESAQGGRDYGERPDFYIPYESASAKISIERSRRLTDFIKLHPESQPWAEKFAARQNMRIEQIKYLPIMAREDWIAVLDGNGYVVEFLKGDGFQ